MQLVVAQVIGNLLRLAGVFSEVALGDPLSAILLLFGAGITLFSTGFVAYLAAGAALSAIGGSTGGIGRSPPPEAK
jgi:hypothetical protein